jgi:RHS repeat-associated protein
VTLDVVAQNQYPYDGDGRICAVASIDNSGYTVMTGYLYLGVPVDRSSSMGRKAGGTRVAKAKGSPRRGTITAWSCDPTLSGFSTTNDYILGLSGEQVTEMGVGGATTGSTTSGLVWKHTNVWAAGKLLATYDEATVNGTVTSPGLHFYFDDPLGTRRVQTDYAGNIENSCSSLPFGDGESCAATPTEHLFTGKERDAESGNDYFEARYYSSAMGRFMSPDWSAKEDPVPYAQLDDPQSLNLYSYVRNNPLARTDPDGHCCLDEAIVGLSTLGGGVLGTWIGVDVGAAGGTLVEPGGGTIAGGIGGGMLGGTIGMSLGRGLGQGIVNALNSSSSSGDAKPVPNPDGQQGAPDHQAAVKEEADKARAQAGPGETVLEGKKIQGHDSTRRPDVQTVGANGKTHTVVEVERKPNSVRHKTRQGEYDQLGVKHTTRPLPPKKLPGQN